MGKKFRFRLAALLRVKRQVLEQHQAILSRLSLELQQARRRVAEIEATIASESDSLKRGGQVEIAAVMHAAAAWEARLAASRVELQICEGKWREANDQYVTLTNELSAVTTLRDRQFNHHQQEDARAEQRELDDVVLRKWIQQPGPLSPEADATGAARDLTEIS